MQHRRRDPNPVTGIALGVLLTLVVTAALVPFRDDITRASPALALVIPVVIAGILGGRPAAVVTALAASAAFSLGFIPPVGTLRVAVSDDAVALGVFTLVAVSVGTLVGLEADRRRAAEQRVDEIEAMHARYLAVDAERERLQDEAERVALLERIDEQRSALLRSVSHDLRTPLASIWAVASDLRSGATHTPEVREELLDMVCDEVERLDRIVANLLSMSRIEAGALCPDRQAVDPEELVGDVVHHLSRMLGDVRVELSAEAGLPLVDVDYVQMGQVLSNILENAARHSPTAATVRVMLATTDQEVEVAVADEGPGIGPDVRDTVFEPFVSGADSTSTGIGLAICKAIVEAHGGMISAGNSSTGGACVRFTMPVRCG